MKRESALLLLSLVLLAHSARAATPTPIVFESPRGGEHFFPGQQQTIRLDAKTRAKSVLIELSRDGGATFAPLGAIDNTVKDKTKLNQLKFTDWRRRLDPMHLARIGRRLHGTLGRLRDQCQRRGRSAAGSTITTKLADGSVTNPKLAPLAVSSDKVSSGPASSGMVLKADGLGGANWGSLTPAAGFTGNLAGDVTGTQSATVVATVGGVTAGNLASGANAANAATTASTPNTIVKRDANGNVPGTVVGAVTLSGDVTGASDTNLVASVGGVTAADVASGANAANAATTASTPDSIVKRDANGDFSATSVTGIVPMANGGTGSATQNFVDLSADQSNIAGNKTFTGTLAASTTFVVEPRPNNTAAGNTFVGLNSGVANTTGYSNNFFGNNAGFNNTTGYINSFFGDGAGKANTTGYGNSFFGRSAGLANTTGIYNNFFGNVAGASNTTGNTNNFFGYAAGSKNSTGFANNFFGCFAGTLNSTGNSNSFFGDNAGAGNTTGNNNTFVGLNAGFINSAGGANTFIGQNAGAANTTSDGNTFVGRNAGAANVAATNTFLGHEAGAANTNGNSNTYVGYRTGVSIAGGNSINNCAVGHVALGQTTNASENTALGTGAGYLNTTGSNNIFIGPGSGGAATESNSIHIGSAYLFSPQTTCYIAGISGATSSGGAAVYVNGAGKLGTVTSSRRFKDDIKPMGTASDALLKLTPVTFTYKKGLDPKAIPQYGLIAEEVAEINPDWVVRDDKGEINTVRYEQINAMLLNEFLKEHQKVKDLETRLARLEGFLPAASK